MFKTYLKSLVQQPYVYSPLSSHRSIRVLTLHNASETPSAMDRIHFTIDECSLDSVCDYWALSYVCGDPRPVADVRVNERFFGVGRNLHTALHHIWLHFAASAGGTLWDNPSSTFIHQDEPRTLRLWIDAISICQGDAAEKARQVRLMKEIFEKAQRVVCWLGEQDEDFQAGYPKLRLMTLWSNKLGARLGGTGVNKYMMDHVADSGLFTYTNGRLDLEPWKALGRFFDRPYWRRTWIVQECTTQATTMYICGTMAVTSRTFEIAEVVFLGCLLNRGFESLESITGIEQVMRRTSFKRFRTQSPEGVNLLEVMDNLRQFEASDARDKVYACISVSNDASPLPIDYSLSVADVYVNFVHFQTSKDRNLDVLGFVGKSTRQPPGLPSWAPDWSTFSKRRPFPKVLAGQEHTEEHPVYHADCFCRPSKEFWEIKITPNRLRLKGVFTDTIRVTAAMGSTSIFDVGAEYSWASFLGNGVYAPTEESWLTAYFRVLVADTCVKDGKITSRASEVEWPDELGPLNDLLEIFKRTGTAGSRKIGNLKSITAKRCFAVTKAGYIGLVPSYAEVGDEIWVLAGGQVLYVLRDTGRKDVQSGQRIHEFLGEAYMHGLMDGEAGNLNRAVDESSRGGNLAASKPKFQLQDDLPLWKYKIAVMNRYELLSGILVGLLLAFLIQKILVPILQRASPALPWANEQPMSTSNVPPPARPPQFVDSAPLSIPNIASLLTEYYNLLIRICYYEPSEIAFPPHPTIDTELCSRLNLSAEAIELMQSIPFPATYDISYNKLLYQSSRAYVFTDPEDVVASRDPWVMSREMPEEEVNLTALQPWEVPIATEIHMDYDFRGYITLLDTRNGTIRLWGASIAKKPMEERQQEENHYLNWPTRAAEAVLEERVENVKTLRQIPIVHNWRGRFVREGRWAEYEALRDAIFERGWGSEAWDREEWARVKEQVYEDECDRQFDLEEQRERAGRAAGS